jgi:hypothetical protein
MVCGAKENMNVEVVIRAWKSQCVCEDVREYVYKNKIDEGEKMGLEGESGNMHVGVTQMGKSMGKGIWEMGVKEGRQETE